MRPQLRAHQRLLNGVAAEVSALLVRDPGEDGRVLVNHRLRELAAQRESIEAAIVDVERESPLSAPRALPKPTSAAASPASAA